MCRSFLGTDIEDVRMSSRSVIDAAVLRGLHEAIGDPSAFCAFVRRYVEMMQGRLDRLHEALSSGERREMRDAALSLRASSEMVGARVLAQHVQSLQQSVNSFDTAQNPCAAWITARVLEMQHAADETCAQLHALLRR